jgi:NAD-dependent SIR2 family protein deacetylase
VRNALEEAAGAIQSADALLIGAGAGMGVDSGLPDFRGDEGFWRAYPPFRGRKFAQMSNPSWFRSDPEQAWGFFGHRLNLYRSVQPHSGFARLLHWGETRPHGYFVFTSNVDGQFQKARFVEDRIFECHGSIHYLQCAHPCSSTIWTAEHIAVSVDEETFRARPPLPTCPQCGGVARPNILMFDDVDCVPNRCSEQHGRLREWYQQLSGSRVVAIELGAGTAIPSVRMHCLLMGSMLIRINPFESGVPVGQFSVPLGALEAIMKIDALL